MFVYEIIQSKTKYTYGDLYEIMGILGIPYEVPIEDVQKIISWVFEKRFKSTNVSSSVITFDYLRDFDVIYGEFLINYNFDLLENSLDWWKFTAMLETLLLRENSITKRVELRSYKTPKKITDYQVHQQQLNARNKYQLTNENNLQSQLKGMFNFMKSKARKKK